MVHCGRFGLSVVVFLRRGAKKRGRHTAAGVDVGHPLAAREHVLVASGHGADGFFGLDLHGAGWSLSWRGGGHIQAGRLVQAVHVALHLIQQPLLLTLRDAAETHSYERSKGTMSSELKVYVPLRIML